MQCEGLDHRGQPCVSMQTVVNLTKIVTPNAMRQCLCFLYTGQIDLRFCSLQVSALDTSILPNWFELIWSQISLCWFPDLLVPVPVSLKFHLLAVLDWISTVTHLHWFNFILFTVPLLLTHTLHIWIIKSWFNDFDLYGEINYQSYCHFVYERTQSMKLCV